MSIRAGQLNTLVIIQQRTAGTDELGQPIPGNWEEYAQAWAGIRHLSGVESIKSGSPVSSVAASIRVRYRSDLDAGMRVLVGATVYEIKAVLPDLQRREFVDLVCQATS